MNDQPEWLNQRIFALLARFLPHLDANTPAERLQTVFAPFRECIEQILNDESVCEGRLFWTTSDRIIFRVLFVQMSFAVRARGSRPVVGVRKEAER